MTADTQKSKSTSASSKKARMLAARMAAVQAVYQMSTNEQTAKEVINEYRVHRIGKPVDGLQMVPADDEHFTTVVGGVANRVVEINEVLLAALQKQMRYQSEVSKGPELLLRAILQCGVFELMTQADIDAPIIISDYINVTHGFYDEAEAKMVNGVLDGINKAVRA